MKTMIAGCIAALSGLALATQELNPEMIKLPGKGTLALVGAKGVGNRVLEGPAAGIESILMIETAVRQGDWSLDGAKPLMAGMGATAAVFVVKDEKLPMSLIAMEEKWGLANISGLDDENAAKEVLRVAAVVLGAASSKYEVSVLSPAFSREDLAKSKGRIIAIDGLMAILPNLEKHGFVPYQLMSYLDALDEGVAPEPANDTQRKIKADWEKAKAAEKSTPAAKK